MARKPAIFIKFAGLKNSMSLKDKIDIKRLPKHIAIIMDGNGRWAKKQGEERIFGHHNGVTAVRETAEAAAELGVEYVTLYAFSTENWNRPQEEVNALMELLVHTIHHETKTLNENNIRLHAIGDLHSLPGSCYQELQEAIANTSKNTRMTLVLALSYSSKWEIINAIKEIGKKIKSGEMDVENITEKTVENFLCTSGIPDPELMIRTSGEHRISNFLLWQLAYAEFYFTEKLWPDFRKEDLYEAILDYQTRERRFGKTSEQLIL
jgi:undecaprenyl diphosphate synthase